MGNFLKALRLAKFIPEIIAGITRFKQVLDLVDSLGDRLDAAEAGKADFVIKAGSDEAKRVNSAFNRVHDLVNKLEGIL